MIIGQHFRMFDKITGTDIMNIPKDIIRKYLYASLILFLRNPLSFFPGLLEYFSTYRRIKSMNPKNIGFKLHPVYPCLSDKIDGIQRFSRYIYQDSWAFRHILDFRPNELVDIASSRYFVGFSAQITKVIYVDIRRLNVSIPSIDYRYGDITELPFENESIEAISSLSVIEHIGLGRYGDKPDLYGMDKATKELSRVLKKGGMLLVAFSVGSQNVIQFNAHRICTPEKAVEMFSELNIIDEKYALSDGIVDRVTYEALDRPYAYGCYRFSKY